MLTFFKSWAKIKDMDIIRSYMPKWEMREKAFINKLAKMRIDNCSKEQVEAAIEKYTQSVEKNLSKFSNEPYSLNYNIGTRRKVIDPMSNEQGKPDFDSISY